jgi:hypothetical protein
MNAVRIFFDVERIVIYTILTNGMQIAVIAGNNAKLAGAYVL